MASTILLTDVKVLADELVCASRHATAPRLEALSLLDQAEAANGSRGFQLLLKSSVAAPVLKTALAETLSNCPSFAGRLVHGKSGAFDVSCCNSGARLVIAATSASLKQVEAAVGRAPVQANPLNPWAAFALPTFPDQICRNQLPLASVLLLHLRGGGALLALSAYAPLADFGALQAFAAHLSATYSTATHSRESQAPGAESVAAAAAARMVEVAASGADGAGGSSSSGATIKHDSHCGSDAVSRTGSHCSMDSARSVCSSVGIAPFVHATGVAASVAAGLAAPCASCGGPAAATAGGAAAAAAAATTTSAPISVSASVSSSSQLRTLSSHPFTFEEITWEEEEQEEEDGGAVAGDRSAASASAAAGSPPPPRRSSASAAARKAAAAASSVVSACCAACRSTYTAAAAAATAASPSRLATALAAAAEQLPSPFAAQSASAAASVAATAVATAPAATAVAEKPPGVAARAALRADAVEALAVEGPLPQGVPERPDRLLLAAAAPPLVAGSRWATWALLAARSLIYTDILGRGCEVRLLHLPTARLAELKSQATAELAQEKEWEESHAAAHAAHAAGGSDAAGCGCAWHGPTLRDVRWVSSNDVLCARLMQLLHSTPLRQMWPSMTLLRPADLRRRRLSGLSGQQSLSGLLPAETAAASVSSAAAAADPLVLGNASYAARLQAAAPSRQSLGRLAGQLRQSLGYVVPQLGRSLAQARAALQQVQAQAGAALLLLPGSAAASHPQECGQSPAGPLTVAALDVRPDLLMFGSERPLAVLPLDGTVAQNTVLAYPTASLAAPAAAAGSSTCLAVALHRVTWRQLDAMYGKDLAAAF